jgi:predicted ATP-grasp superfamily ATP-dependent carboligase
VRFPAVLKPRDGAGSQATFLVPALEMLPARVEQARAEAWRGELVLQPFIPGRAVSVAFLLGPRAVVPLLPATQELSDDGRFRYRGGRVPLTGALAARAVELARRAVAAVPGLAGYVGVDSRPGERDVVIEINRG